MADGRAVNFDKLLNSCWRASDNSIGQIILNYNKYDITFNMEIDGDIIFFNDDIVGKPCIAENLAVKALSAVLVVR